MTTWLRKFKKFLNLTFKFKFIVFENPKFKLKFSAFENPKCKFKFIVLENIKFKFNPTLLVTRLLWLDSIVSVLNRSMFDSLDSIESKKAANR